MARQGRRRLEPGPAVRLVNQAINAAAPRAGVVASLGIAYGAAPRHRLDVYAPAAAKAPAKAGGAKIGGVPVVVFFYGGGWQSGARAMYRFVGATLAARGVMVVIPDYRLYPQVRFPLFVEDAAAALAWVVAQAGSFGGDPGALFLMGHSAGAQIATLLALNPAWLAAVGHDPARDLRGVIGLAGPYDFLPLRGPVLRAIFGARAQWPHSQPITYARADAPPLLLLSGGRDHVVDPANTQRLAAAVAGAGGAVSVRIYPRAGHNALVGGFSTPLSFLAPVRRDVLRFIRGRLGEAGAAGLGETGPGETGLGETKPGETKPGGLMAAPSPP